MSDKPKTPEEGLRFLADWLDLKFPNDPDEIQQDCRRWADEIEQLRAEVGPLRVCYPEEREG